MTHSQAAADAARNVPAPTRPRSVTMDMADRFSMDPAAFEAVVRATCIPTRVGNREIECTREQFAAFLTVARDYGLNPITREIFAFPNKSGGITPIVSIDGWLSLANRQEAFDGFEFDETRDDAGKLVSITATVHRKDREHPTRITEYLAECARDTEPWTRWPARMLRHKAVIQAIRYAFSISGIYEPDEAERGELLDVTPARPTRADFSDDPAKPAAPVAKAEQTTAANNGGDHVTQERAGATPAPADPAPMTEAEKEAAEREADRMVAAAARGEASTDEAEEERAIEPTPIPMKKGGGPDWIKWHTQVAARLPKIEPEHRAEFLAVHDPALSNYREFSPQNAATLRSLISGEAP